MVTVLRHGALRVVIFKDDHSPAHMHVFGDGEAKIDISGPAPRLILSTMRRGELRRASALVAGHQAFLLDEWRKHHG
ncbi:DUF4160 domain-containing protein [Jiella endophytica]|uniref:DUF4160 domain-containing protein n=1 Tax=Jiella endophytica TaxID=2558362 RepID=A0A4Y8RK88_9HYPH|nr:DUF4160 domain-containing protein [Jiella endophytica]TFF22941.1 DUF4160 domain-containing protein [Jiella endophytica]